MSNEFDEQEKRVTVKLKGSSARLFEKCRELPGYQNNADLFRDMIRVFAETKGVETETD